MPGGGFGGGLVESERGRSSGGVAARSSVDVSAGGAPSFSQWVVKEAAGSQPGPAGSNLGSASAEESLRSSVRLLYEKLNLKITEDTRPDFTNANLVDQPTKLGAGQFHTVFAVKLEGSDGKSFDGVFKPLGAERKGWAAQAMGIPKDDPQVAMRNLATLSYAKKLGIDVIPDTRLAVLSTGPESKKLGLVMARASGTQAAGADPALFGRADVCAELTKLQLLDHLTGQGDRHGGNYFIDAKSGRPARVTGIDNDQCFGAKLTRPDSIRYAKDRAHVGFHGTSLPPVVDREMAAKITALTPGGISQMLGDKLTKPEVQAAIARHQGVTQHLAELSQQGRVISSSKWGRSSVQKLLTPMNSYLARDRERALAVQARLRAQASVQRRQASAGAAGDAHSDEPNANANAKAQEQ